MESQIIVFEGNGDGNGQGEDEVGELVHRLDGDRQRLHSWSPVPS